MVYNGYVYEIGGYTGAYVTTVDYAPILSSGALGSWTAGTSLPEAMDQATSVEYGGFVYEIGGYNGSSVVSTVYYSSQLTNPASPGYFTIAFVCTLPLDCCSKPPSAMALK